MIDLVDEIEEVVGFHAVLGHEPPHRSAVTLVVVFLYAERLLVGDLEVAGDVVANALVHLLPEVEVMRIKRVVEIENPGFHMAERARRGTSRTHDTDAWSLMTLRSGRSNARMMRAAIRAMPAIIRKNIILSMPDQKLPSHPAIKLPAKLVASQTPINIETIRTGAIFDTSESPIGERQSSPMVMTTKYPSSQSQLASSPAARQAAVAMIKLASVTPKQPIDILVTVEGSLPGFACQAQSAMTKGVKAKIMNGLNAWNQVTGMSPCQRKRSIVRLVWSSAHSTIVLPCCSYVAQNKVVGANSAMSARIPRHSLRSSGFFSVLAAMALCSSSGGNSGSA